MSTKLKPCPFCGAPPSIFDCDPDYKGQPAKSTLWMACCPSFRSHIVRVYGASEAAVVREWNRRVGKQEGQA